MNDITWQVRGPRSKQAREAKRLMLLQTAARMFNERGFENTSLTDIAETLGITKPSLYYYVKNKEAIFLGIFEITREKLLQVKNEAQQAHLTGLDQLTAFMDTYIDLSTGDLGKCVIRMNSIVLSEENAHALEKMKPSALIVNTSRGPIINEKSLIEALEEGKIGGAAIDVYNQEPTPLDNPLLKMDNVVLSPHCASASWETRRKMAERSIKSVREFLKGKRPPYLVPEQWDIE